MRKWAAIMSSMLAITAPTERERGQDDQARARHQARLTLIRGRGLTTLPRPAQRIPGPARAIAFPNGGGPALFFNKN